MTHNVDQRLDEVSGYRRRFIIIPSAGRVMAALEDDYHAMAVTLVHDGTTVTAVETDMERAPWTTCPGAPDVLVRTFTGVELADVAARGDKQANCTHLHDLAILAAAHVDDAHPTQYYILVSDVKDGHNASEIRRDGQIIHRWEMEGGFTMRLPDEVAGLHLMKLRSWIATLDPKEREAAKLLQWGSIVAHGRARPLYEQSDASKMPPSCYSFQPERAAVAKRVGLIIDFSLKDGREPLAHFDGLRFGNDGQGQSGISR